jgi:hypothetical protein
MISSQYIIAVQCCSRFCARNSIDTDECDTKDPYYYQFHQNEELIGNLLYHIYIILYSIFKDFLKKHLNFHKQLQKVEKAV